MQRTKVRMVCVWAMLAALTLAALGQGPQPATQQYVGPEQEPLGWTNVTRVTVGWDAPSENEDGTPLKDLAGYRVYDGATSGFYTVVSGTIPAHTNAPAGPEDAGSNQYQLVFTNRQVRFIAVTALDTSGNESDYSEELMWTNRAPGKVLQFQIEHTEDLTVPDWDEVGFFRLRVLDDTWVQWDPQQ
jgi:hypothetical protein